MQMFVNNVVKLLIYLNVPAFPPKVKIFLITCLYFPIKVWKKVVYADRLLQLFKYVPREQLTIPDFVFQLSLLYS